MITGLTYVGHHIVGNGSPNVPYISPNHNNPLQGVVRVNGSVMEAFNGGMWVALGNYASVGFTQEADEAMSWAIKKMAQEREYEELAKSHESIRELKQQAEEAQHKLTMMAKLVSTKETV